MRQFITLIFRKQDILGATQMEMSQPFGSLFNPTLVVKEEGENLMKKRKE